MQQKMGSTPASVEVQFAQKLASNEVIIRNKAVKKMKKWFSARTEPFAEMEMMRLWKGLYYCYWMSDKPLVQEELAENISSFISTFQTADASLLFIQAFLKTFGREWFGIDKWRKDKFMMFTRRFLRASFKFVSKDDWKVERIEKLVSIFEEHLILSPPSKCHIDFKLHFTDVFLEELAKVAEEKLPTDKLEMFLAPYLECIKVCDEERFREHVAERIFRHLLRQSDPGIKWQDEEFEDEDEENVEENDEEEEKEDESDGEEAMEEDDSEKVQLGEDPRAGGVHSVIPQLAVNYEHLAEIMFKRGSEDGLKKSVRNHFYQLSKMFKDVANDVFPLGPNLEDLDEDIEKIKVTKAAKRVIREREETKKQSEKSKAEYKKSLKQSKEVTSDDIGDDSENENEEAEENEEGEENAEESTEQKMTPKERERLRKKEQKRRKKERLQKQAEEEEASKIKNAQEKETKDLAAKALIDHDLEKKSVEVPKKKKSGVLKEKKDKLEEKLEKKEILESKKKKKNKGKENLDVTPAEDNVEESKEVSSSKKKKKKKDKETASQVENTVSSEKKLKRIHESKPGEEVSPKKKKDEEVMKKPSEIDTEAFQSTKSKKKKLKKALYRIDSDIAFNSPSLSQINLMEKANQEAAGEKVEVEVKEPVVEEDAVVIKEPSSKKSTEKKKLKKMKKYNAETSLMMTPSETPIIRTEPAMLSFNGEEKVTPKSSKTKTVESGGAKSSKLFEENGWDEDLKPGESEIFLPNKKYKRDSIVDSVPDCPSPAVTPAKAFTATFIKKAMSKSEKKEKKKLTAIMDDKCMSEPRKKRVNVVLTKNSSQNFAEHLKAVRNSPQTPHDPTKNPAKSALKKTPGGNGEASSSLNPVNLNTQLNARSKATKLMNSNQKSNRKRAMDFF